MADSEERGLPSKYFFCSDLVTLLPPSSSLRASSVWLVFLPSYPAVHHWLPFTQVKPLHRPFQAPPSGPQVFSGRVVEILSIATSTPQTHTHTYPTYSTLNHCSHTHMHTHSYTIHTPPQYMYSHTITHTHIFTCIHTHVLHTYPNPSIYIHTHTHSYMHTNTHTHITHILHSQHMYSHTVTYTHTFTYSTHTPPPLHESHTHIP